MKDVSVKKSPIHGKGVFANRNFVSGEVVIDWMTCSDRITTEQMDNLPPAQKKYVSYLNGVGWVLFRSPGKYVNHSCSANTEGIDGADVAVRDIDKGEEISANYVAEKVPLPKTKCLCGSDSCQGFIGLQ